MAHPHSPSASTAKNDRDRQPRSEHPEGERAAWSVVIPTYNGESLLRKHLPDVLAILDRGDEIIVVDDASTDSTVSWCESQVPIAEREHGVTLRVARHAQNQRFAAAVNTGVRAARHPFVFLLNNDVSPLTTNLKAIVQPQFAADPQLFAVGCAEVTSLEPNATRSGRGTGDFRRGLLVHWYDPNQDDPNTLWTSGGSMVFRRQAFLDLDGMDTLFYPAYEEDRDLSYRAVKNGWHIRFEPKALVLHQHESTNTSVFGQRRMQDMSWKNQFLLVWKNITDSTMLAQHLLWLPYHLTVSNWRSQGSVGRGFLKALAQLPQALRRRALANASARRTDREVLAQAHGNVSE